MDDYLDDLSVKLLRLYCKKPDYYNFNLSQLEAMTDCSESALCSTITLLRKRNYIVIDPSFSRLNPKEIQILGDTIARDTPLRITKDGLSALEKYDHTEKCDKDSRIMNRLSLIATFATLLVSIATLIVSIFAMLRQ